MYLRRPFLLLTPGAAIAAGASQWGDILGRIKNRGDDRTALGLQEALSVGAGNAASVLGRKDGYFANLAVKILLPPRLRSAETGLRIAGLGPLLAELGLGMHRAAARPAPFA